MTEPSSTSVAALIAAATSTSPAARHYGGGGAMTDDQMMLQLAGYLEHRLPGADPVRAALKAIVAHSQWPGTDLLDPRISHLLTTDRKADWLGGTVGIGHDFDLLEAHRSDIASLARFSQRLDKATYYLCIALEPVADQRFWHQPGVSARRAPKSWQGAMARQCFARWRTTRAALVLDWSPPEAAEPLFRTAFWSLCELTPADHQLKMLFDQDRSRACRELVRHVDVVAEQLSLATDLAEELSGGESAAVKAQDRARLDAVQESLLDKAGERLSLTQAAERLEMTRQGLHKKIKSGAALGLVVGETLVIPSAQFVESDSGKAVVAHLKDVLAPFSEAGAGPWSALQFLVEIDPALGAVPLDALKEGDTKGVVAAARAYLGLDEG